MTKKYDYYFDKGMNFYEKGKYKKALKFLLKAEKYNKGYASINIGIVYSDYAWSLGKKERNKAKEWDKKAIAKGDCSGMNNIAVIYREEYRLKKAKKWFKRAIQCGEKESAYELAKIFLMEGKIKKAIKLLEIFKGDRLKLNISEGGQEDALVLLNRIKRKYPKK